MVQIVTGGAGFIGSHLVAALVDEGHRVKVIDNLSSGQRAFLEPHLGQGKVELVVEDLLTADEELLQEHMEGADIVHHLAANPEVRVGATDPRVHLEQNVVVTHRVIEAARQASVKQFTFTSTSTVYGEATVLPTPEDYGPLYPISLYGASKLAAEALISSYCHTFDMRAVAYRFANCVGPNSTHGVTYDFVAKLQADPHRMEILGDGRQLKSYFHVSDCITGMLTALPGKVCGPEVPFAAYNIGSLDAIDVVTIADTVAGVLGLEKVEYSFSGGSRGWVGDVAKMMLDSAAIVKLGWKPRYTSQEAIRATAQWLAEQPPGFWSQEGGG